MNQKGKERLKVLTSQALILTLKSETHSSLGYMGPVEYEQQFGHVAKDSVQENTERSVVRIKIEFTDFP